MSAVSHNRIYLDHAATTPMSPLVREAMLPYFDDSLGFGNPSSLHYWGRQARQALEASRASIAENLGAQPDEIIFTSGATEANNQAILGVCRTLESLHGKRHLISTRIEHSAVDNPCDYLESQGWEVTKLPVDAEGFISLDDLKAAVRTDTAMVSIIHGNNEIGTVQPVESIGAYLREQHIPFHTDAVQTVGKLPFSLSTMPVDYLSLSGHKIYGPKGIGALYVCRSAPKPTALLMGGGQESSFRSGTENLAGIVGLAKALEIATSLIPQENERLWALQEQLIQSVLERIPGAILNGPANVRLRVPGNVNFSFPPAEGESLVLHLDLKGIAVSSGSACHSAVIEPSRIVKALGQSDAVARATVRLSLGRSTDIQAIHRVVSVLSETVARFQKV